MMHVLCLNSGAENHFFFYDKKKLCVKYLIYFVHATTNAEVYRWMEGTEV